MVGKEKGCGRLGVVRSGTDWPRAIRAPAVNLDPYAQARVSPTIGRRPVREQSLGPTITALVDIEPAIRAGLDL